MTRRLRHGLLVLAALVALGGAYALLVPAPQTAGAQPGQAQIDQGRALYERACISCHGANLQGAPGRGPGLVGVGDAAVYFQVSTGRMPLARAEDRGYRKVPAPEFDPDTDQGRANLAALGAYIEATGGGPEVPAETGPELIGSDVAHGGELYRLNCASCHQFTGRGGILGAGRYPPRLDVATPEQMYTAMLSGPMAMPVFGDKQLTPEEKKDIIAYVLSVRGRNQAPGGFTLGELGPTTEGLVAFVVGLVALIGVAAWIGARS
ncbi:cytochrome c [Pseudonocardia kujensis]|uniref:cytochrome bc1 complex diheme cytochrome c subunit n=1 Tax=Pseudonocardia kujensis TaxID=1128675 RepID=UPI001E513B7F|nr:cytochrome c [Pseudonocardia kujensis]MCE0767108.1 cytochrome c [Pseudonocardia kujensis]